MANKLFLVSATLAFFFLLTNASIYRTVVELEEDDATNPMGPFGGKQKCRREFQQSQHLRACQQWLHKQARRARRGPWALEDELAFEDDMENSDQHRSPLLQQCCNELHQEEPDCVCPTLKQASKAVRHQIQQQGQPQVVRRIYQTAQHLPNICRVPQVSVCPFRRTMPFQPPY
ncbi:unnamed protein product [Eruca vesicaria subsp. sativa]|uniref:Bifunctional inhibitor/plant lipid transfer protein/seed storage helical domain-containing protein n=1 Tax=Eruca vesicaria subsp. sativa TaxID=29727 RepID=A0ABC8JYB8_ERUVS|nr:unnamed protein product [Eruca vesicaria subsp. sativa]